MVPIIDMTEVKRVLITGIAGFTGQYLEQLLRSQGHQVWGVVHQPYPEKSQYLVADLTDAKAIAEVVNQVQPHWVVHLAAIAYVAHHNVAALYEVNLIGSRYLLEALASLEQIPEAVLLASSANIYGNVELEHIGETTPAAPANDYAVSKYAMELMAQLWQSKLPLTIVRPFNYTGDQQSEQFLIPKIVRHFRQRAPFIELGNINVARDFSDVRDVVAVYAQLLKSGHSGQTFNVCSAIPYTLQAVLDMCSEITGHQLEVRVNPAFVRKNEVYKLTGSNEKLRSMLGMVPTIPLRDTLSWMLETQGQV